MENNNYEQDLGTRLKQFRQRSNKKMPEISAVVKIAKETLYKWEKGTKPSDVNEYRKLEAYLEEMEKQDVEYKMEIDTKRPITIRLPLDIHKPPIYNTEGTLATGTILIFNDEPQLIVERVNIPYLGAVEGAIQITGNSMEPTFKNGSRIAICRLKDIRLLDSGRCYFIINKNLRGMARRVYQSEGGLQLVSDHPDKSLFPPIERSWDQIETVLEIVGNIDKL